LAIFSCDTFSIGRSFHLTLSRLPTRFLTPKRAANAQRHATSRATYQAEPIKQIGPT
jgi:hypothetical protein